jgi:hypothetical protein
MMETAVMQHTWVKHVITKVEVLPDDEGQPVVMVDPMQQELAEEDAAYGCQVCGQPMAGNFGSECEGIYADD